MLCKQTELLVITINNQCTNIVYGYHTITMYTLMLKYDKIYFVHYIYLQVMQASHYMVHLRWVTRAELWTVYYIQRQI